MVISTDDRGSGKVRGRFLLLLLVNYLSKLASAVNPPFDLSDGKLFYR